MLETYRAQVAERAALGIPPLPLTAQQTAGLVGLLKNPPAGEEAFLIDLITNRVPAGVDDAAKVKAEFLAKVAKGEEACPLISKVRATELLGTMLGGFNIKPLIDLLACGECGAAAAQALKHTLLMFDFFNDVKALAASDKAGSANAKSVMQSWADAEWFTSRPGVPESLTVTIFKVTGETNTDDLSPAPDAWSRPDIPLHAVAMLKNARPGIEPDEPGKAGPLKLLQALRAKGHLVAYVGDVVGTGSSRKSATNSVLWFTGEDIPYVPNKRFGGVCLGAKIAPIFFNTMEDAGALPIELDVSKMDMGDVVELRPIEGKALKDGQVIAEFKVKSDVIFDEVRAGGRIPLIVGRALTAKARAALGLAPSTLFRLPAQPADTGKGYTLAQKIVGRACGLPEGKGVRPGAYCEPRMTTVGSQDTTGPMTRDEMKDLACMGFSADLVMQSFCHTAAYPKPVDVQDPRHPARLHLGARRRLPASRRRRHPHVAEPHAAAGHGGHRRRLSHPLPAGHFLPGWFRPRRLRGGHRHDAARYAGIGAGALQGHDAAGHHAARSRQRHPLRRHPARPADRREEGQEKRLLRRDPGNRGPGDLEGRAGIRAGQRLG